jgi:hypothetical protein
VGGQQKKHVIDLCMEDDKVDVEDIQVNDNDDDFAPRRGLEEEQLEVMMASGGDYSPNSHTFFK